MKLYLFPLGRLEEASWAMVMDTDTKKIMVQFSGLHGEWTDHSHFWSEYQQYITGKLWQEVKACAFRKFLRTSSRFKMKQVPL